MATGDVDLNFTIQDSQGTQSACHVHTNDASHDVSVNKYQFWDVSCLESAWHVSWGYMASTDGGILTVCRWVA